MNSHSLKRVNGVYYADGKAFATFKEALAYLWQYK